MKSPETLSAKAGHYLADERFSRLTLWITTGAGIAGLLLFYLLPEADMAAAGMFFANDKFILRKNDTWDFLRTAMMWGFALYYIWIVVGLVSSSVKKTEIAGLSQVKWLYLVICSLVGPLLLTNLILKTHIGRDRPTGIDAFGGEQPFKPFYELAGKCLDNCSFVSGEVSSMVMIMAAMMFVTSGNTRWLFAALLLPAWVFSAIVRMGMGAHFLSDVFFAGIFMILIAGGLYRLIVMKRPDGSTALGS